MPGFWGTSVSWSSWPWLSGFGMSVPSGTNASVISMRSLVKWMSPKSSVTMTGVSAFSSAQTAAFHDRRLAVAVLTVLERGDAGHGDLVVAELEPDRVGEHLERRVLSGRGADPRVDVDHAVGVAVDPLRVILNLDRREEGVAGVDAVGGMPVVEFAWGGESSAVASLSRLAKITSAKPSTSTTAIVTGNVRLRC